MSKDSESFKTWEELSPKVNPQILVEGDLVENFLRRVFRKIPLNELNTDLVQRIKVAGLYDEVLAFLEQQSLSDELNNEAMRRLSEAIKSAITQSGYDFEIVDISCLRSFQQGFTEITHKAVIV